MMHDKGLTFIIVMLYTIKVKWLYLLAGERC
jgi:hypothetical protein